MTIPEGFASGTAEGVASVAIGIAVDFIKRKVSSKSRSKNNGYEHIPEAIRAHLIEVDNWSGRLQLFGMDVRDISEQTIRLSLHTEPRKFRGKDDNDKIKSEEDLLIDRNHYLLLGDPGSGKTTTLKRLSRKLLLDSPSASSDVYQYPIVVRLRELSPGDSLFTKIADIMRLKYDQVEIKRKIESKNATLDVVKIETRVNNALIEDVISDILNKTQAVLILDGLDEIKFEVRNAMRNDILSLARKLMNSKIILSLRSGDFDIAFEGFNVLEICPLTTEQIRDISGMWLQNPDLFLESLNTLPYYDVADRPLLLTQLLFLFKRYGYLPEQPSIIYKKIVRLLLEDWDAQRTIVRFSKYSSFDPERKMEFLSALAFQMTYFMQVKRFTEDGLITAYLRIYQSFNLDKNDAKSVANEIQTHSGIMIAGPDNTYEFSHLSLQEYLCANYLVRAPLSSEFAMYIETNTAPVAVAVVLSSTPGNYFAKIILNQFLKPKGMLNTNRIVLSFLTRLIVERPFFEVSELLAFAIYYLNYNYPDPEIRSKIAEIMAIPGVYESMALSLRWYTIYNSRAQDGYLDLKLNDQLNDTYEIQIPKIGSIPKKILSILFSKARTDLYVVDAKGNEKILTSKLASQIAS